MGQRELDQGRGTAKCFLIYLINCIERQVEENQVLNLVEKRIRDKSDVVPRQVQVFQTALYWVQGFYGDFRKLVESHFENFKFSFLKQGFWEGRDGVVREVEDTEVFLLVENSRLEKGE